MPDLFLIPDIASYFGITIDELFDFTPNKSREMQIEMYFQALYHLMEMSTLTRLEGLLALISYIKQHEINPLMYEGVVMIIDSTDPEIVSLYLKAKGKNEYTNFDENYVDCIVTGIKNIQDGRNQQTIQLLAMAYVPKNINKAVVDKFEEACKENIEKNRQMLTMQTIKSDKTNLLEFITGLSDEKIQQLLQILHESDKAYMLITAMSGSKGEVNKRILQNIISDDHILIQNAFNREWYLNSYNTETQAKIYFKWIYYFIYSTLYKQRWSEDYICQAQQIIVDIYNKIE